MSTVNKQSKFSPACCGIEGFMKLTPLEYNELVVKALEEGRLRDVFDFLWFAVDADVLKQLEEAVKESKK